MKIRDIAILIGTIFLLAACGGGGGGGDDDTDPMTNPAPAQPRVFIRLETGVYSSGYDGSDKIRLTPAFSPGDEYGELYVSPNRLWVAIEAILDGANQRELYVVSATGQGFKKISVLNNAFNNVSHAQIRWSPNSDALVYEADDSQENNTEIFLVTIDNNGNVKAPQKINGSIGDKGNIFLRRPAWSSDGSHVAYLVYKINNAAIEVPVGVNTHEVGTVSGEANFSVRVSKPPFSGQARLGSSFAWSPVENQLIFRGEVRSNKHELFLVSASEDQSTYDTADRVISDLLPEQFVSSSRWSDNGRYIAYDASFTSGDPASLNVYDDDLGTINFVNLVDLSGSQREYYEWVPGSDRIAVFHSSGIGGSFQLTTIGADGGNRHDIPAMDSRLSIGIAPDGSRIAAVDIDVPGSIDRLFFVSPESSTIERAIDLTEQSIRRIGSLNWSPYSDQLIFISNEELYKIDVPNGDPDLLSTAGNGVGLALWSPEGDNICYFEIDVTSDESDLYCVKSDGSGSVNITKDIADNVRDFTFVGSVPD